MDRLPKKISLVVAAAAVAGGPTTVGAQAQRGGGRQNFFPRHPRSDDDDRDRVLRSVGDDANVTAAANATVPEVASIVNGTATGGPLPYMVGLTRQSYHRPTRRNGYFTNCGGTLIGPSVVLTAAHCVDLDGDWDPVDQVLVNLYDKNDRAGVVAINIKDSSQGGKDIVVHPGYNPSGFPIFSDNDIALMFLPVGQLAEYVKPNDDPNEPVQPNPLRVMGWGWTEFSDPPLRSDVLLETTVEYISNEECKEAYADTTAESPNVVITDGMMCGYKKYTGSCIADSGGPAFLVDEDGEIGERPTQVGIASWSAIPCASPGYPDVYTRVSYYEDWIKETVCSRPEHATKELCGSSKARKLSKRSYAP